MSTNRYPGAITQGRTPEEEISSGVAAAFLHLEAIDRRALGCCHPPLTNAQFHALAALQRDPGRSLGDLAARLLCDKANASGIVNRLTTMELATRVRDPLDGRRVVLTLTAAGESTLAEAHELRRAALSHAFVALSVEQRAVLGHEFGELVDLLAAVNEKETEMP